MANQARPEFEKRPDSISLLLASAHIAFALAPVYSAAAIGPSFFSVVACVWFGASMHGLLNLMHETAHWHVFRARGRSDALGRWLLGPMIASDFDAYRQRHWQHHRELGTDLDTKFTYRMGLAPADLVRFVLGCLVMRESVGKVLHARSVDQKSEEAAADGGSRAGLPAWVLRAALVHVVLVASLCATSYFFLGQPWKPVLFSAAFAYAFVYWYGLAAVTPFVAAIRTVAEHHLGPDDVPRSGNAALRNFESDPLTRLFLSGYGFAEHATHHRQPGVPAYRLRAYTRQLCREEPQLKPCAGYLATWRMLLADERRSRAG